MKTFLFLALQMCCLICLAQNYPVTSINISIPATPDATTANWRTGNSLLTITAMTRAVGGRPDSRLEECRVLVTIKKAGGRHCGLYTAANAPLTGFNSITKVWSGAQAVSLLGQDCELPAGSYEICVQFFDQGPAGMIALSEEKCRSFTIAAKEEPNFQQPGLLAPANRVAFSTMESKLPLVFRWTPVVPRPTEPVTYRLRLWQAEYSNAVSQPGTERMESNLVNLMRTGAPAFTKEVVNLTQATLVNAIPVSCQGPGYCGFIWNVQALNRDGKPIGGNNGTSEYFIFSTSPAQLRQPPVLVSPSNGETILATPPRFSWKPVVPTGPGTVYKIKIVEILGDQSPEQAFRGNKPFFEKDSLKPLVITVSTNEARFRNGGRYAWMVQSGDVASALWVFKIDDKRSPLVLTGPADLSEIDVDLPLKFSWRQDGYSVDRAYRIRIVEVQRNQSPEAALRTNKPHFERDSLNEFALTLPGNEARFKSPGRYAWQVVSGKDSSKVYTYIRRNRDKSCRDQVMKLVPNAKASGPDRCCYDISVSVKAGDIHAFRLIGGAASFVSAEPGRDWITTPPKAGKPVKELTFTNKGGSIRGEAKSGTVCFTGTGAAPFFLVYEWLDAKGGVVCRDSVMLAACTQDGCRGDLVRNGTFVAGNQPGAMPAPGQVQYWAAGYGSPAVNNDATGGFAEKGYVILEGNAQKGEAVSQALDAAHRIMQGKKYRLSVAVRFQKPGSAADHVKIRAIAYNGSINSSGGFHPVASTDVAIIGRSARILDCGDWAVIEFPSWTAGKDFSNIAINAFTNDGNMATVWIDAVTFCEGAKEECNELQADDKGNPVAPAGSGSLPAGTTCAVEAEVDEYYNGSLQDLYPGYNGTTDIYDQPEDCFTLGGTLPEEVIRYSCDDSLRAAGIEMTCAELQALLLQEPVLPETKSVVLPPLPGMSNTICDYPLPAGLAQMPFGGRDIIYIHGLQLDHLIDRSTGEHGATGSWPSNQNEYYNGYYRNVAVHNMLPHIFHFLRNKGHKNRFLIVSYDCSQDAATAVHAVLTQIREAMQNGTGVQADSTDPRQRNCFARDYVFVSHSTGALVADVALSIASQTSMPGPLQTQFGNLGLIASRCKGRMNIQGAYSGSNLAKIALMGQNVQPALLAAALTAMTRTPFNIQNLTANPNLIANSILVDLTPSITRSRWSALIDAVPVPVFSIAGGHPSAILGPLKYSIHPGFDDGVLTMDCVNGNNNPLSQGPSSFSAAGSKVFDMGIPLQRAVAYYLDRKISDGVFATASTSYLSPTGMVEPPSTVMVQPQNHFNNHFSFLQSTKEHWFNATEPGSGNTPCDYGKTSPGNAVNNEEVLVVTNPSLFTPGLIHPDIIAKVGETQKDMHINYPWIKIVYRHGIPRPTIYWKKYYIWKRTYHKLMDNCQYDVDYGYNYLFRQ